MSAIGRDAEDGRQSCDFLTIIGLVLEMIGAVRIDLNDVMGEEEAKDISAARLDWNSPASKNFSDEVELANRIGLRHTRSGLLSGCCISPNTHNARLNILGFHERAEHNKFTSRLAPLEIVDKNT